MTETRKKKAKVAGILIGTSLYIFIVVTQSTNPQALTGILTVAKIFLSICGGLYLVFGLIFVSIVLRDIREEKRNEQSKNRR